MVTLARAIEDFQAHLADERRLSPRSVLAYRTDLARFVDFWQREFGEEPAARARLARVDALAVRSYLAALHRAGLVNRSIARHLSTLRSFFRWACREGHLEKNPARGFRPRASPEACHGP